MPGLGASFFCVCVCVFFFGGGNLSLLCFFFFGGGGVERVEPLNTFHLVKGICSSFPLALKQNYH